ncbi:trypsin-like serine protease [Rhodopirellula sp. SWK7]|uniref:trypsin-like serine protease n=1 Tax=Rhodopirellula sp. SWK7 TaxID=595460 RepID=UPI0002BEBA8C|nr:trypsin-like serine protease [Rhodopirellula sp. SWK7]EMI41442.1 secreted protein [Rhodopirellula sp. SWK7]
MKPLRASTWSRAFVVSVVLTVFVSGSCNAMIWHRDAQSSRYHQPEGVMTSVVSLHYTPLQVLGGCGVLLNADMVLTAGHAVDGWAASSIHVRLGDHVRVVEEIIRHPNMKVDLAVIRLAESLGPERSLPIAMGALSKGERVWLGGYGISGPLIENDKNSIVAAAARLNFASGYRTGRFASGYNRITHIGSHRNQIVFDAPGGDSEPEEVLPSLFDSGSPVFVQRDGEWRLAGITVTVSNRMSPNYGDRGSHESVHAAHAWLVKVLADR